MKTPRLIFKVLLLGTITAMIVSAIYSLIVGGGFVFYFPVVEAGIVVSVLLFFWFLPRYSKSSSNFKTLSVSDKYTEVGGSLAVISDKVAIGAAEVSHFLDQLNQTINDNVKKALEVSEKTGDIFQTTEEISQSADEILNKAENTRNFSQEGMSGISFVRERLQGFDRELSEVLVNSSALQNLSKNIQGITGLIENIAVQTNLLSINAAIEAANAGEQGKGFGVVAQEIRSLSSQTKTATREIDDMLRDVHLQTTATVESMGSLEKGVEEFLGVLEKTSGTFSSIHEGSLDLVNNIQQVSAELRVHVDHTSDISDAVADISGKMDQTGLSAGQVSSEALTLSEVGEEMSSLLSRHRSAADSGTYSARYEDTVCRGSG